MRKLLDAINVIDVESTCWDTKIPPDKEISEIIEIGICSLDVKSLEIKNKKSVLLQPKESTISPFCTKLTTTVFEQVCFDLRQEYLLEERVWASYGDYDRNMFQKQCSRLHIQYPFGSRHINIKTLIALTMAWDTEVGMDEALNRLELPLVGTHHRAGDDAANIAQILSFVLSIPKERELTPKEVTGLSSRGWLPKNGGTFRVIIARKEK